MYATARARGFEDLVVEDEEEDVKIYVGQVDLDGKQIFSWVLVGFWAGDLQVWSKELNYLEFWEIYGSDEFTKNIQLT